MMSLLDPWSSHWAIRHIYLIMALVSLIMFTLIQPIGGYLDLRDQDLAEKTSFDDPSFMYIHDGGDATLFRFLISIVGLALLFLSVGLAIGYALCRRGVTFQSLKMKHANDN